MPDKVDFLSTRNMGISQGNGIFTATEKKMLFFFKTRASMCLFVIIFLDVPELEFAILELRASRKIMWQGLSWQSHG